MVVKQIQPTAVFFREWRKHYPVIDHAKGMYLYDQDGRRYLDGAGGVHVVSIGHGVDEVIDAMERQVRKVCFAYSGQYLNEAQIALSDRIIQMAPEGMSKVYFVSGGSEANEVALKVARQYFIEKGKPSKYRVVGRWQSYHGSTIGAMSMTGHVMRRRDYIPYLLNFPHIQPANCYRCPFGKAYPGCDLDCAWELDRVIRQEGPDSIAAFIAEPIVGTTAAALTPPPGYYEIIRQICDKYDVLFIADEVITGFGRTGRNFGIDHWSAIPDIMTCAKGLASGYMPIGAVILRDRIWEAFEKGPRETFFIGYTYTAHPVVCAVGLAVQEYVAKHNLVERSATIGEFLKGRLEALKERCDIIGDVRGKGLLLGIEFVKDRYTKEPFDRSLRLQENIVATAFEKGLILIGGAGTVDGVRGDHILVTPPYIITEEQCEELVGILEATITEVRARLKI